MLRLAEVKEQLIKYPALVCKRGKVSEKLKLLLRPLRVRHKVGRVEIVAPKVFLVFDDLAVNTLHVALDEPVIKRIPDGGLVVAVVIFGRDDAAFFDAFLELFPTLDPEVAKYHLHHVAGVLAGAGKSRLYTPRS